MTDAELNRRVARARGWKPKPGSNHQWIMPDGRPSGLPLVCTNPAAWGALFQELAESGHAVEVHYGVGLGAYVARVDGHRAHDVRLPGRALALAFLGAVGR